jgi:K+-transporting ATPase ATPase B chain
VNPGDLIATDGEIIEGLATIDSAITQGESAPVFESRR